MVMGFADDNGDRTDESNSKAKVKRKGKRFL